MCLTALRPETRLLRAMLPPLCRRPSSDSRGSRVLARTVGAVLALVLPSCSSQYSNPFENTNQMAPPAATARIIVSANTYAARAGGGRDLFAMDENGGGLTRLTL